MPYMDHQVLVRLLTTGWRATCNYKQFQRKKAFRLCLRLEADNKADPDELDDARNKREDLDRACALANMNLYKMRVLNQGYDDDVLK